MLIPDYFMTHDNDTGTMLKLNQPQLSFFIAFLSFAFLVKLALIILTIPALLLTLLV